jgi:YfiR/HmsC-like
MEILTRNGPQSRIVRWLVLGLLITAGTTGFAQSVEEYDVKAAFLFNFTKFIEWPPSDRSSGNFIIGIFGDDPFGHVIDEQTRGKTVNGRQIEIRRLKDPAEAKDCHIVFVTSTDKKKNQELLDATNRSPVLTVGETKDFLNQGGVIAFAMNDNHVGVIINNTVAVAGGFKVSAKLLSLATIYGKGRER